MRIAVAGAGIAGLTTAIALADRGFDVDVFERATALGEIGAGIQLSPNATSVLEKLGVLGELHGRTVEPEALVVRDATSGDVLTRLPLGATVHSRYGGPYFTLGRADLQSGLLTAAHRRSAITLHLGAEVNDVREADQVVAFQVGREQRRSAVLVAADGVRSQIRTGYLGQPQPRPLQHTAWRALLPDADIPASVDRREVGLWLGAGCHLVHYPIGGPAASEVRLNLVLIGPAAATPPRPPFGRVARSILDCASAWKATELFCVEPSAPWVKGRVALVGDAAHAMSPSAAQGGAQAIEDAWVLAAEIANASSAQTALARYQQARRPRVERVARLAARNLTAYELRGLSALFRNALLKALPARLALSQLDWLFGWRPQ